MPVERVGVINVSWTAPSVPSGELPITGYRIKLKLANSTVAYDKNVSVASTSAEVTGLHPNTEYTVYVASLNGLTVQELSYCCNYDAERIVVMTHDGEFL